MKAHWIKLAVVCAVAAPSFAYAQAGDFMVRARATYLKPADKSQAIPSLGVATDAIEVSSKTIPEVDFVYFFTNNIAGELVLTVPQKHDVTINGIGKIGTFKHLPPTLLAQYHFNPSGQFNPYVGAGINFTHISSVKLNVPGVGDLDLESTSVGPALQAGFDVRLDKNWSLNFDVKYVQIRSDVMLKATNTKVSEVEVDPYLISVGVGYRF